MDMYGPALEYLSQLPFDMNSMAETSGYGHDNLFPNQTQAEQEAIAYANAGMPFPGAGVYNYSELHATLPGPPPAGAESWNGAAAQAPQYPPQAQHPYANLGYVQHPAQAQQYFAQQRSFVPRQFPHPQQPAALHHSMAPQQPVAFPQHFAPDQFAPQPATTTAFADPTAPAAAWVVPAASTAPAAPAAPQAGVAPPVVSNSEPLPSSLNAVHVFEANVKYNRVRRSAGLRTWMDVENDVANENRESSVQFVKNWEEPLLYMSKQDFQAYYYKQCKLALAMETSLPDLPSWISAFVFGEKGLAKQSPPLADGDVAKDLSQRSLRGSVSSKSKAGPKNKGKGKARATPYTRAGSSLRPSSLGNN